MDSSPSELISAWAEHIDVGVILLDQKLHILYWNALVSRCSGKSLQEARQHPFSAVFPEADATRLQQMAASAGQVHAHDNKAQGLLKLPYLPAGRTLQDALLLPFHAVDGQVCLGLLLYDATDQEPAHEKPTAPRARQVSEEQPEQLIRKLEKANAQLLQSEKLAAIGQLAAGVAHEINNPIGYVFSNLKTLTGYVNDLLRIIDSADTVRSLEELQQIKRSLDYDYIRNDVEALIHESEDGIDRVKKIITALKDFSHIEEEAFHAVDLHRGLDSTLNLVNNELKYKADVVKDYGDLPLVECIPSQINQVAMNLLINAAHAIEGFGRIIVRTGQEDAWAWLEVEDNGKGIDPRILNRIYEPFFTTKPVGKGTGLGLALSYNIVQKHNGRIEAFSQPGAGARFRIWLPIRQPGPSGQSAELPA